MNDAVTICTDEDALGHFDLKPFTLIRSGGFAQKVRNTAFFGALFHMMKIINTVVCRDNPTDTTFSTLAFNPNGFVLTPRGTFFSFV